MRLALIFRTSLIGILLKPGTSQQTATLTCFSPLRINLLFHKQKANQWSLAGETMLTHRTWRAEDNTSYITISCSTAFTLACELGYFFVLFLYYTISTSLLCFLYKRKPKPTKHNPSPPPPKHTYITPKSEP